MKATRPSEQVQTRNHKLATEANMAKSEVVCAISILPQGGSTREEGKEKGAIEIYKNKGKFKEKK